MSPNELTCRHCGRPLAAPTLTCPWPGCGKTIMVICASCKQYTDDQGHLCQHCGALLEAATSAEVSVTAGPQAMIAQLAADRRRAQLLASGVLAAYTAGFFLMSARQQTILVDLFGTPLNPERRATTVLFGAIAYLVQEGYCTLQPGTVMDPGLIWSEVRQWDGQQHSWEGKLACESSRPLAIHKALKQAVAEEMDFRFEVRVEDHRPYIFAVTAPGGTDYRSGGLVQTHYKVTMSTLFEDLARVRWSAYGWALVRDLSLRPPTAAIVKLGEEAVLPEHEETTACREIYQMLLDFVGADPERARYLAHEILMTLDWFRRFVQDPQMVLYA